ncbi:MAG TPA: hypothetical protein VFI06_11110 [Chitinophagaceae bacterium]|nr:hypothetical protein [Chitinophagaceae bacterium]
MSRFRDYGLLIVALVVLAGCKGKKKPSLSGEDPVEINDFIEFFPARNVPYQFGDTTLNKKENDSTVISANVFAQFIPDSLISRTFGKNAKLKIYPLGRLKTSESDNLLFVKMVSGDKRAAFVFAFDKKDQLKDGLALLRYGQYPNAQQTLSVDKSYTITKTITRRNTDGTISDGKDVYGLEKETGKFMLIMTDALDDKVTEIINPIADGTKKHKYAADYTSSKLNLVSIRDGRKPDRLSFFVHIDKNDGGCTGELKGEAIFKSTTVAEYREGGDPCVLQFTFSAAGVALKELEGCGSRRGLRCSFDGSFAKKKEPKPAKKTTAKNK